MSSTQEGLRLRAHKVATNDAAKRAYEAARLRFETIRKKTLIVSIQYVRGDVERDHVRSVTTQYLAARSALVRATERLRLSQKMLTSINP